MKVSSTEIQNNFGKYLILARKEDIIITRNGTEVARLIAGDNILHHKGLMDTVVREENADYYAADKEICGRKATYEEFQKLVKDNEDTRYEYIDGEIFVMESPKTPHQSALTELFGGFYIWFQGKKCRPFVAPYDIILKKNEKNINVVQPDLMVICDLDEKLGEDGYYKGVPALTLEIISGGTARKDLLRKMNLYRDTGVREYWVVDPSFKAITIYRFNDRSHIDVRSYEADTDADATAESFIFEGLSVDLKKVFR